MRANQAQERICQEQVLGAEQWLCLEHLQNAMAQQNQIQSISIKSHELAYQKLEKDIEKLVDYVAQKKGSSKEQGHSKMMKLATRWKHVLRLDLESDECKQQQLRLQEGAYWLPKAHLRPIHDWYLFQQLKHHVKDWADPGVRDWAETVGWLRELKAQRACSLKQANANRPVLRTPFISPQPH